MGYIVQGVKLQQLFPFVEMVEKTWRCSSQRPDNRIKKYRKDTLYNIYSKMLSIGKQCDFNKRYPLASPKPFIEETDNIESKALSCFSYFLNCIVAVGHKGC